MHQKNTDSVALWQFENLAKETSINHFVTGRYASPKSLRHFTLSYSSSPNKEEIRNNRTDLANALGIDASKLFLPSQVHKTNIVRVTGSTSKEELMDTDALITNEKGICIAVMSADCVPILLFDKRNNAIAAIHSGWRGTVAKILEKTLHQMRAVFNTKGEDLVAGIGPSVCQDSYEVGEEVVHEVNKAFHTADELVIPLPNNKAKFDLWKANKLQLLIFGVKESSIEFSNLCTVKNNEYFFSARKGDTGRFAAGILLV